VAAASEHRAASHETSTKEKDMPKIKVLLDRRGRVLGTAEPATHRSDSRAPAARLVPREDQTMVEVSVTDAEARLDAASLLKVLKGKKLG
jgi:hypothetical protein